MVLNFFRALVVLCYLLWQMVCWGSIPVLRRACCFPDRDQWQKKRAKIPSFMHPHGQLQLFLQSSLLYRCSWSKGFISLERVSTCLNPTPRIPNPTKTKFPCQNLLRRSQKPLYDALVKMQEELMLLGFISILLTVFQGAINRFCIPESIAHRMLPCRRHELAEGPASEAAIHTRVLTSFVGSNNRHLLSSGGSEASHCKEGKKPFLSIEAMHELHIFIFVLAVVYVLFSVMTTLLGIAKIRTWSSWEKGIPPNRFNPKNAMKKHFISVAHHDFVKSHAMGIWGKSALLSWMVSFFKQFYGSVTKTDYSTLRLGFIQKHCSSNPNFDFHKYMLRTLEADCKKVVNLSGYLWSLVVIYLLLNIHGWHAIFWIAFIPLILLLAVGTKLEHIITQLAQEVAEKHTFVEGDIVIQPSDELFWFGKPKLVLYLIHFILFQNAFEIAFFFWILTTYGFHSCIMGKVGYIIPRLVIGIIIQVLCSYSTFPLYALVTQMGTSYKMTLFGERVRQGLSEWQQRAKRRVSTEPDDDNDRGNLQLLKINDTSQIQSESIHDYEITECSESKIDMPKS